MKWFEEFRNKKTLRAIGLMSGTSVDGLDIVLIQIEQTQKDPPKLEVLSFVTVTYPPEIRKLILANTFPNKSSLEDSCRLNFKLGHLFSEYLLEFLRDQHIEQSEINFIGSHGHTLIHLPKEEVNYSPIGSTLQIGDPSIIANKCGIVTVGDFRVADMALGGDGAPLVPIFDYLYFTHQNKNRIILNIGGIANITALPVNVESENVVAFDTGPGNVLIDYFVDRFFNMTFDKDGKHANSGTINTELLEMMLVEPYFHNPPPKSTGRELFLGDFLEKVLNFCEKKEIRHNDVLTTVTELTAKTIFGAIQNLYVKRKWDEIIASGGGVKNQFLMKRLQYYFPDTKILTSDELAIQSECKEAVCFAFLAYFTLLGRPNNLPSVTGAKETAILGKICFPNRY